MVLLTVRSFINSRGGGDANEMNVAQAQGETPSNGAGPIL
jgi:hypothetical protein